MAAYNIGDPEVIIFASSEQEALAIFRSTCPDEECQDVVILEGETEITLKWTHEFDPEGWNEAEAAVLVDTIQTLDDWEKDLGPGIFAFHFDPIGWHRWQWTHGRDKLPEWLHVAAKAHAIIQAVAEHKTRDGVRA